MTALRPILKAANYVLIAVLGSLGAILTDRHGVNAGQVLNLIAVALTAGVVWAKANSPDQPYAKAVIAVLGAGVTVFVSAVSDGHVDATELVQITLALLGALQVATVANVPPGPQPAAPVTGISDAADRAVYGDTDHPYSPGRGGHAVTARQLGRRPASDKPVLRVRDFLALETAPLVPATVDHLTGFEYELGRNDQFGTCGPTALANYIRLVTYALTGAMATPTWADIKRLYVYQNPDFDEETGAGDGGVDMKTMLADAVKHGFVDQGKSGPKVLGFAAIDVSDPEEVEAAVAIFGGSLLGVDLQTAQQQQSDAGKAWDYSPSGEWGGHAVCEGAYEEDEDEDVITWAERVKMTRRFVRAQRQEAYVVILDTHLGSREFMAGWDLAKFAAAYTQITGRPFPAITPPNPPEPPPRSDALVAAARALAADPGVVSWCLANHAGQTKRVAALVRAVIKAAA